MCYVGMWDYCGLRWCESEVTNERWCCQHMSQDSTIGNDFEIEMLAAMIFRYNCGESNLKKQKTPRSLRLAVAETDAREK
jgi:hypothetical protein